MLQNEERNSVGLKDDDVFEVPGDRSRFCEVPDLDTPLACIFRGKWHTFRVCRQLRYIIRGMVSISPVVTVTTGLTKLTASARSSLCLQTKQAFGILC